MGREEVAERLKRYLKRKGLKQEVIASQLNTQRSYLSSILTGKRAIGVNFANRMQEVFGISAGWLLTGEGSMMVDGTDGQQPEEKPRQETSQGAVSVSETQLDALARTVSTMERNAADLMRQNELLMRQNELLTKNLALVTEQLEAAVAMLKSHK